MNLGIDKNNEEFVRKAILNKENHEICSVYNQLLHVYEQNQLKCFFSSNPKKAFRKINLQKSIIKELNRVTSKIDVNSEFEYLSLAENDDKCEQNQARVDSYSSMQTNVTSTPYVSKTEDIEVDYVSIHRIMTIVDHQTSIPQFRNSVQN